jgi:nicotinate-nucleotide adenylyltransferase
MKIGIYGICGNPPHVGHVSVSMLAAVRFDEVWVMPCYSHMHGKQMADPIHRMNMCEIAFRGIERVKVSDHEIKNKIDHGTYKLLLGLRRRHPEYEFWPVIGQDNANSIHTWAFSEHLIKEFPFFIVKRPGIEYKPFAGVCEECFCDKSATSTEIRNKIASGESIDELVHSDVAEYIRLHRLYVA